MWYKFIALYIKESNADHVEVGGAILSKEPVSFADVIEETQGIIAYTKHITKNLADIVAKVNSGEATLGKLLNDEELNYATTKVTKSASTSLDSITQDLRNVVGIFKEMGYGLNDIVGKVNNAVSSVDTLVSNIKEGKGVIGSLLAEGNPEDTTISAIINNLKDITDEAKTATVKLNENMEALKHNWLFKGYFEERGYWDAVEYEKEMDSKTKELNEKIQLLEEKINELKSLETNLKKSCVCSCGFI